MDWNPEEVLCGKRIAGEIADFPAARRLPPSPNRRIRLPAPDVQILLGDISLCSNGDIPAGALAVRQICRELGFDDRFPFRWPLDHKLVQALVLDHFCPGSVPVTCGLYRHFSASLGNGDAPAILEALEPYHVKRTDGYGSPREGACREAARAIATAGGRVVSAPTDEQWILQEKLQIVEEYRVNTVEDRVVEDLTFARHSGRIVRDARRQPNEFVTSILERLPNAFVKNSICGWDVATTDSGAFRVVEVNLGGVYSSFRAGYRVSGEFSAPDSGPVAIAKLVRHLEAHYGVTVEFKYKDEQSQYLRTWYRSIELWSEMFRISRAIGRLVNASQQPDPGSCDTSGPGLAATNRTLDQVLARLKRTLDLID
jgi:hypothetical protein